MAKANPSFHQYEPLRAPKGWTAEDKKLIQQLSDIFDDIYRRYGRLRIEDMGDAFRNRIVGTEGAVSEIEQTADNIWLSVGADKIYRAASEAVLIAELGARAPALEITVNMLWYDTTLKIMKRCTAVGPPAVWEVLQAKELHGSYVDINDDGIDIKSGGSLTITAPGELAITSGATDATAVALRNDTDYFLSAGNLTQSLAPFFVKKDGSVKASAGQIGKLTIDSYGNLVDSETLGEKLRFFTNNNTGSVKANYIEMWSDEFESGLLTSSSDNLQITSLNSKIAITGGNGTQIIVGYVISTGFWVRVYDNIYIGPSATAGICSAYTFTDRTPFYDGDALADLASVKGKGGNIDHNSLPKAARIKIKRLKEDKNHKEIPGTEYEEDGRDLGMMISILTKAVQQLTALVNAQQKQIDALNNRGAAE